MWHTETDLFAFIIFFIMLVKMRRMSGLADRQKKALTAVLLVSILGCIVDYISSTEMNLQNNWFMDTLFLTLYYTLIPAEIAAWMIYMVVLLSGNDSAVQRKRMFIVLIPIACYSVIGLTNPLTGAFFTLSREMQYSRGPLFWPLAVGFYSIYSLAGLIVLFINRKKIKLKSNMLFLSTFFVASIMIPLVQVYNPGWLIAQISYAVLYILCDATVEEEKRRFLVQQIRDQNEILKKSADVSNAANKAKTEFLSRMSHDIRTPLNGIIGMTYLTQKMDLPKEAHSNLDKISTSSKFLLGLVNDILDMSKAERKSMELHPEPYPFEEFSAYIDAVIRPLCNEKQQEFILEVNPVQGCTPLVDITHLNQIYFNLLSNAVKYTPERGTIRLHISETLAAKDKIRFIFTVSDNGIGMSREFQKHLFEPFMQENRNDNSEMRGTGLGLAIVKRTVDAMGGVIRVESEKDKGTKFTVEITSPCGNQAEWKKKEKHHADGSGIHNLRGRHVLLCEDHPLNQEIAVELLKEKGIATEIAENGQIGVQKFDRSAPDFYDAILMDIRMPVMDGYEATEKIRKLARADAKTVPIIAMTADAFSDEVNKCLSAGMNGHIAKPVDPEKLYRILNENIRTVTCS